MERRGGTITRRGSVSQTPEQIAQSREMTRRWEWRHRYPVPIYVMWASDVPEDEAQAGLQGVVDTVRASEQRREIINFGSTRWGRGDFSSADWYVEEAIRREGLKKNPNHGGLQVVTNSIGKLFSEEPWQELPHWEVLIMNKDLTTGEHGENFVFGATSTYFPYSIQSVARLEREISDREIRLKVIRRVLRHEVGHMFGLAPDRRRNTEEKLGTHCSNVCTMRQGMSSSEWVELNHREETVGIQFCGDCMQDFARVRSGLQPLPSTTGIITL